MKKSILGFLLHGIIAFLLVFSVSGIRNVMNTVEAAGTEILQEGDYKYEIIHGLSEQKCARIREYTGTEVNLTVPDEIGGYPVYEVCLNSFRMEDQNRYKSIQSVTFPKTMVNLNAMACMSFSNLTSVTLPEGVQCIGIAAFNGCSKLSSITLPASVTNIVDEISDNAKLQYCVQNGSYADQYLTNAGKTNIIRTGSKVTATDLTIEGKKEYNKTVAFENASDSRMICIQASFAPGNASYRRVKWTVSDSDIIEFNEAGGLNNYGDKAYFRVKKGGQAVITAASEEGGYTAKCVIEAAVDIACHDIALSQDTYEYDGKEKRPGVTVEGLIEGADYFVTYSNNIEAGTATVTINGIGLNTGSVSKDFVITPKKAEDTPPTQPEDTPKPTVTPKPSAPNSGAKVEAKKPTGFKVKNISKKKAKLTWKPVKGAKGYEIYRSTKKNGKYKKIKTITKKSTVKYTNSKLKKKKQYYYKIRSYKVVGGKKYYSAFTNVKSVKIKK